MRSAHDEYYECLPQQWTEGGGGGLSRLEHSPYSLDLAPSGFDLFGLLKEALRGRRCASNMDVPDVVQKWLHGQLKTFHQECI
ncbi:hypothetical protein TNIN_461361 [Trichonephila inaurata madagascariensis]|uniref:Uncharacterized protein n=1 Tax=Trichonephila inaurata madagascariensis TaxID=2747483 RepID=A0A8X6MEJ6_9ARAC|nr:hypothetical protein TNIN_461361 [Trichonephila inaurata madagascariensis]